MSLGVLLTKSCTTGWRDWLHGELWCLDDGLLRTQLGLGPTLGHLVAPTVNPSKRPTREFKAADIALAEQASIRNVWLPRTEIREASLRRGWINGRLEIETDERLVHFMWFRWDRAFDFLAERLDEWLDGQLYVN